MMQHPEPGVTVVSITQATTATFTDLYIQNTALFYIEQGSKRVEHSGGDEVVAEEGDVLVFPPDSVVTIENRTLSDDDYQAMGVMYSHTLIERVFPEMLPKAVTQRVQRVSPAAHEAAHMMDVIRETLANDALPASVREHRLLEPLVWLKAMGVYIYPLQDNSPLGKVRALIETDLAHSWRSKEVADHFAMSEATLRRWLAQSGGSFSRILINTRLERGIALLQTTDEPISAIALDCGFKTPSHFSDAFKTRFGIPPRAMRTAQG